MRAWPSPDLPAWPDEVRAPGPRVHSSSAGRLVDLTPAGGPARMYVCGITPYDATHLGHAATYLAFDLLNRAWRNAGHEVRYVQNVTDVDEPLLERARDTGQDWTELAERETDLFRRDMTALRILAPDAYVGAVEAIPDIAEMVEQLRERGATYEVDGDLYFRVHDDPAFGEVSRWTHGQMLEVYADRGGDPDRAGKQDPLDCLLWHAERPDDPHDPAWDSALGRGRPGWHVECAAIARTHLGGPVDVQGGGSDLVFPHHEMSAAEAQVAEPGQPFARAYVHAGMVAYDGEKMSKSKGNLVLVSALLERGVDPMALRLALLGQHYRSDWEWTEGLLDVAVTRLAELRQAVACADGAPAGPVIADVLSLLADDLDAPAALVRLHRWAAESVTPHGATEPGAGERIRVLADRALGLAL